MKKKILIIASCFIVLLVGLYCFTQCLFGEGIIKRSAHTVSKYYSPNGEYTLRLMQKGEPQWSFGGVEAKLRLEEFEGNKLDEVSFSLANDGGPVEENNIVEITWLEDRVEVLIREFDTTQQYTYVLKYGK